MLHSSFDDLVLFLIGTYMVMIKVNGEASKLNLHSGTNTNSTSMVNITAAPMVNTKTTGELNAKTGDFSTEVVSQPRKANSANENNVKDSSAGLSTSEQVKLVKDLHLILFWLMF